MISIEQAKQMAAKLKASLELCDRKISYSIALETVAHQLGFRDWNTAAATLPPQISPSQIHFSKPIPILRIFDVRKAQEFYLEFLSFRVEFEHRFEPHLPLYMGIAREGLQLHLSEHHGDASPGATIFIPMKNIALFRDELHGKQYGYGRPEIVKQDWGDVMEVHDPFGNRLRFCQS
ncbi:glyoxalase superfamily protein [Kosakonia sp. ML.JS2a]|uniref:glyoxalase superfamily protein n=1 Tax=Kosakonia sp. ML.JS2a TaxID=2980557 RepID=UPI0021D83876|nr:glyoxalase superfamily protein [Kosakonia sp. ML.JS2a]UXY12714.1 glyoxalase superfamily protein [Kosakonia sp. ML.JS2a]